MEYLFVFAVFVGILGLIVLLAVGIVHYSLYLHTEYGWNPPFLTIKDDK